MAEPAIAAGACDSDWRWCDRPGVQAQFVRRANEHDATASLLIGGVHCSACVCLIEDELKRLPGVNTITVDALTTRAQLCYDPAAIAPSRIFARLAELGYRPQPWTVDAAEQALDDDRRRALYRLIIAGLGMMQVLSFAVALYAGAFDAMDPQIQHFLRLVSLVVAAPVVLYSGMPFFVGALRGLAAGRPGMDVPVALAIGSAFVASVWNTFTGGGEVYFDSATMFVFFLTAARFLELGGRRRALTLTGALARRLPASVTRLTGDRQEKIGINELVPGDLILVRPGAVVPADGRLDSGEARVDESVLTGESRAATKRPGDAIVGGSLNLNTAIRVRVVAVGAATAIAEIGRLIAGARDTRPRTAAAADRIANGFVIGVLVAAFACGAAWWLIEPARAFSVVLAVLVVSCPCALAIATPAAYTVATSLLARLGVLVRNGSVLDRLDRVTDIVVDKTGTLTGHRRGIGRAETFGALPETQCLAIAAALEAQSGHPIAEAFRGEAVSLPAANVTSVPGAGLEGDVAGHHYRIGTLEFAGASLDPDQRERYRDRAERTVIYLGDDSGVLARFRLQEEIRPGTREAIGEFMRRGLAVTIASGDRAEPVRAVADYLGVDDWFAALFPAEKLELARRLQAESRCVAMIGDGINDAPVLAGADVSIALGSGTSLAQVAADCVIVHPELGALPRAINIVAAARRTVRQSLAWAVAYNVLALPLAAFGILAPWMAALGMSASSLVVTLHALGLARRLPAAQPGAAAPAPKQPVSAGAGA